MPYLCDTNVLLRFTNPYDPECPLVRRAVHALLSRGEQLYYTQQNRREFWNVCTRPLARNGLGLTIPDTLQRLAQADAVFRRLPDRPETGPIWDRLVTQYGVIGVGVHDAHLAAFGLAENIPAILTLNTADFRRYAAEITAVHPRDVAVV